MLQPLAETPWHVRRAPETISLLQEGLIANAAAQGEHLLRGLRGLQKHHPHVGDVRGLGLMAAIEVVKDPATKEPDVKRRERILQAAFRKGLLLLGCGQSSIRFCPPLTVTSQHVDECLGVLEESLRETQASGRAS